MRNVIGPGNGNVFKGLMNTGGNSQNEINLIVRTVTDRNQYNNMIVANGVPPAAQRGGMFLSQSDNKTQRPQ